MESYIFAGDEVGQLFAEALAERARAGVDVRVHLDAAGARGWLSRPLLRMLGQRGVRVKWYHRWSWRHPMRYNRRNHRKLLVVDDRIAYVGGFNIHPGSSRRLCRQTLRRLLGRPPVCDAGDQGAAGLAVNDTRECRRHIRRLYPEAIAAARQRIHLTTPYFVLNLSMQQQLMQAAHRGVDVRLLVPSPRCAADALGSACVLRGADGAGVSIHEYLPRTLHANTMTIDRTWAVLGTPNFDYRSFLLNHELVFTTSEARFCELLEHHFNADLRESTPVIAKGWATRSWPPRVLKAIGWSVRRWL